MKIIGLVQARMGSTRLPGKVMKPIEGKPLVGHIISRLNSVKSLDRVVLATTKDIKNDILENYCLENNVLVYRHHEENDIAGRLYEASKLFQSDAILKINADCPLVDPLHMNRLVNIFIENKGKYDFVSNKINDTLPEGFGMELINHKTLKWCNQNLHSDIDRELTVMWIIKNISKFQYYCYKNSKNLNHFKYTVDTPEDFKRISSIFNKLYKHNNIFGLKEVISLTNSS